LGANLENSGLMTVLENVLANPVTNKRLTELLKKAPSSGDAKKSAGMKSEPGRGEITRQHGLPPASKG